MALITSYWGLDGLIIFMAFMITAYLYMTRKFKYWKKRGVLELTPTPFFGNFMECLFLKKAPAYFLKEIYEETKGLPYVGFYVLDKPFLLIRDRELVKNILVKDFNYFSDRYNTADPNDRIGYANLFFIRNPTWKAIRTKLTPFFTSGKMKKMFDLMLICVKNLDEYLESLNLDGKGKTLEVRDITARFTTDIIGSTAYGLDVNSFKDPDAEFRRYGKMIFQYDTIRGFEMLAIFFLPTIVRLTKIKMFGKEPTEFLRKVFWETLSQRMKSGVKRNDLIDILIELKNNNNDKEFKDFTFDGDDLLAQAASFFSAGFETSSTTTSFALYELAIQPELQNTLRKEILEALEKSNGKITYDMAWSLPYLDMVISETLRMYPPLGYVNRVAMETYKVPEYNLVIEKGTPCYIPMLGLHYDPEYFPNPNKFDPERFNEENKRNRPSCVYFPFGEGPHACIGNRFGLLQAKLTLLIILSKYEVTPSEKTSIPVEIDPRGAMTAPLNGVIYLNFRKVNVTTNCINHIFKFDGDDLMAQAASFFSAGFETSAVPIAFTLYELALHPEIQNTVRNEMLQVLDDSNGKITYDMIMSLPYLDTVVFEILRMYPPLSFLNRMTMQTYKVPNSDLVLEKGTPIYIPMLGLHYDPEYFPDPYKFDPERFNEQNKHNRPSCVYLPFGEGPHACIGTRFGLILIKLTLIKILSKYEVIPCEKTLIPMVIEQGSTMTSSLNGVIYLNMREINTIN
ncbi:cytochrome P450 6k1-like [Pogonomyrmex barbatus]|uniref:Cytochrome P450 6k1-like n=1 Tax=Pogonomyrmex barbatus TaxID=144034 RepID=A0A8N1S9C1_9HYME|nr:cytochrome P450 6k1-like [Pogonomyrmex barbatus]